MRLSKLKNSKQVTLKQIESLLKESKSNAVQQDPECKKAAQEAEQQHHHCRQWLNRFEAIDDINDLNAVSDLINEATAGNLGFVLEEFTVLKEEHYESLVQINNCTEVLFKVPVQEIGSHSDESQSAQVTFEGLKHLIMLKHDISDSQGDEKQNNGSKVLDTELASNSNALGSLADLLDQKGNDIDLLQSIESLVEVWRAVSRRALTVAIYPAAPDFTINLHKVEDGY